MEAKEIKIKDTLPSQGVNEFIKSFGYLPNDTIGERLRIMRKNNNLSLQKLSKKTGISFTYLQQIETGKRRGNIEIINNILAYYNCKLVIVRL